MPSFPKDHPATHNMCRNPKHDDEGPVCCCFPNKDCYWDEIGGSSITQPLGMSGEEEWWEDDKFYGQDHVPTCDIPAILKEHRRLVLEEVREIVRSVQNQAEILWDEKGDRIIHAGACETILNQLKALS